MDLRDIDGQTPTAARPTASFDDLPSEVIQQILSYVSPVSLSVIQRVCRRLHALAREPLLWRYNCRVHFKYWQPKLDIPNKFALPATEVDWHTLFIERWRGRLRVSNLLDDIVGSQQHRIDKIETLVEDGYDAKDTLLEQASVGDDVEDCLARRWWSGAALGLLHRRMAIETWMRAKDDDGVTLEQALGAFDVFTLGTRKGDFDDITTKLDHLAAKLRVEQPEIDGLSTRRKALILVDFLRSNGYTGIDNEAEHYHDIQNNYIGYALHDERHQTLPLILAAIYICLARRFSVDAYASNVPMHIFGLVKAPAGETLNGGPASPGSKPEQMFIDPFHHNEEVSEADVRRHLRRLGITDDEFEEYTSVASVQDLIIRTSRNIMTSAQTSRERDVAEGHAGGDIGPSWVSYTPSLDESFYGALWALLVVQTMPLEPRAPAIAAHLAAQQARMLPLLLEIVQSSFPWDVCLLEKFVLPRGNTVMVGARREIRYISADHEQLAEVLRAIRTEDQLRRPQQIRPSPRFSQRAIEQQRGDPRSWSEWFSQQDGLETASDATQSEKVKYRVGCPFRHKRYGYEGVIVGWDTKCAKDERWISQMNVNRLPGGRDQSFYHVLAADKSARYVAEENIEITTGPPSKALMMLAGRYFKRFDQETGRFISNVRDEYPDD